MFIVDIWWWGGFSKVYKCFREISIEKIISGVKEKVVWNVVKRFGDLDVK